MSEKQYAAAGFAAGDAHYRAYVGPPERYDLLSISQVALLHQFGLREHHYVLDFGCGSLRLGRMLLPFLLPGRYFGVEPNEWLIDAAFDHELGHDIRRLKAPHFSADASFDCTVFDRPFDFIVAQSIITHSGVSETMSLFRSAAHSLNTEGLFLFSFIDNGDVAIAPPISGWVYPNCVCYAQDTLRQILTESGLVWKVLSWPHPGAKWAVAARSSERLHAATSAGPIVI